MFEFPCPHCSVPLRLRDSSLRGRTIACPDCGQPVTIREVHGAWRGEAESSSSSLPTASSLPIPRSSWIPWIVAGTVGLGLLLFVLRGSPRKEQAPPQVTQADLVDEPEPTVEAVHQAVDDDQGVDEALRSPVEARLEQIYQYIREHHEIHDMFPRGTVESPRMTEDRFSWIADIRRQQGQRPEGFHAEQPWNVPAHDDFVRRRFPEFLNPLIDSVAGEDRYPASHFVGVTGVGRDAATLPKNHPRAGIFGEDRQTTTKDVVDGLAHTLLIAGVNRNLGSWARGGQATMRGFTKEPYINGPDGFGTGQQDGMFVLMADGSVRMLSARTDPVIIRRMAAMADGLPLDPSVPGDPLTMTFRPSPPNFAPPLPDQDDGPPIEVLLAPDTPSFDLQKALRRKLLVYRQQQAVPLEELLWELEELIGAPVDVSHLNREARQQEVAVDLQESTLAEILQELARHAGLRVEVGRDRIRIHP